MSVIIRHELQRKVYNALSSTDYIGPADLARLIEEPPRSVRNALDSLSKKHLIAKSVKPGSHPLYRRRKV